jgi:hypothetical protein
LKKTIYQGLILIIFTLPQVVSCTKSEMKSETCFPTLIANGSDGTTTAITYDASNHVSTYTSADYGDTSKYTVTTNANGDVTLMTLIGASTGGFQLSQRTATYDQNNRLISDVQYLGGASTPSITNNYTYNASGQLTQVQALIAAIGSSGQDSVIYSYTVFTYTNTTSKNPSQFDVYHGDSQGPTGNSTQTSVFTYDTKIGVGNALQGIPEDITGAFLSNNVVTSTATYHFSSGDLTQSQAYSYIYNSNGYVVYRSYTYSGFTATDTFTYHCK